MRSARSRRSSARTRTSRSIGDSFWRAACWRWRRGVNVRHPLPGIVLAAIALSSPALAQVEDRDPVGAARVQAGAAIGVLDASLASIGRGRGTALSPVEGIYEGEWRVEGHFRRPHETRTYKT